MSSYQNSSGNQPLDEKSKYTASTVCKVSEHNRNAEQLVDGYSMKQNKQTLKKMAKKTKGNNYV